MDLKREIAVRDLKLDKLKATSQIMIQMLRELDEAMDSSTIEIKQGSGYHLGIKELLKEIDN